MTCFFGHTIIHTCIIVGWSTQYTIVCCPIPPYPENSTMIPTNHSYPHQPLSHYIPYQPYHFTPRPSKWYQWHPYHKPSFQWRHNSARYIQPKILQSTGHYYWIIIESLKSIINSSSPQLLLESEIPGLTPCSVHWYSACMMFLHNHSFPKLSLPMPSVPVTNAVTNGFT